MNPEVILQDNVIIEDEGEEPIHSDYEDEDEKIDFTCHRLPCCAHSLQLVIKDGLSCSTNLTTMINKISKIVNKIHKTSFFVEILEELKLTVASANITRWNSQLKMIKSVLKIPNPTLEKLCSKDIDLKISQKDRVVPKDLFWLLEPFHDLTIDIQKDFGSISTVYPAFKGLLKHINQIKTKPDLKDMADELDRSLKSRFSFVETNPIYVVAILLNPSFIFFFNDPEESLFYERVLKEQYLNYIRPQSNINIEPSNKSSTPTKSYLFIEKPLVNKSDLNLIEVNNFINYMVWRRHTIWSHF
ncbi:zinc finger BED domain-containing 4-like [Brachionus plicatilis]|uniref:Zinc finger BED domain-containing 4-like n=1 Tax=Brachionus plicatilis TaxID=10195 RepID=A0A3M7S1T4_BRAPC|nr:zinc finger BED domain-containing 4-like [Brachionus plicatilis]